MRRRKADVPAKFGSRPGRPSSGRRSSDFGRTFRCGGEPSLGRCCASKASPSATRRSGGSSPISWRAASWRPSRPCVDGPTPGAGRPSAASPSACRAISSLASRGGLIQIDTVYVNLTPTKAIKHFTAYDPVAKWTVGKAFNRATAQAAASFLDKVTADMPFPIRAIQVDGGSEFMAEFEKACQAKGIALYVLPPRSPQMNGAVERCNGAWRYEFYETYRLPCSVNELNPILDSYQHLYNHHRPHGALAGKTPTQYLANRSAARPQPSHMS
jgi:Integrase core domain